jgi:VWFA-related protein
MKRFAVLALLAALAIPAAAQEQPFQEQIEVNAVLLDVIVTDARGNHILGLGPDDFIVKENGVAQKVDSVDYFTNRRLLDSTEENAPFKVERVREDRYFIFFFDKPADPGPLNGQLIRARQSVREFLRRDMKENDLVAIAGHDVRLKVYSDFSHDRKQLERALNEATQFGRGITKAASGDGPSILRNIDTDAMINHTGTVYQALDLLGDATRSIRARKNLVLFSPGIADREEDVLGGQLLVTRSRYLDPAIESLNASNVAVYGVQLQQVQAGPQTLIHQRLGELSDVTGGKYFQFNTTFDNAVNRIEEMNAGYYLLSYRAPAGTPGARKVEVTLRNPEFKVVSRSGYSIGS